MRARFRVRTRAGRDLEAGSIDCLQALVDDGEVNERDLLHDALSGRWIPAGEHAVFRLLKDPLVKVRSDEVAVGPLGFTLAPAAPEPTHEEAIAAVVAERTLERESDPDFPVALEAVTVVDASTRSIGAGRGEVVAAPEARSGKSPKRRGSKEIGPGAGATSAAAQSPTSTEFGADSIPGVRWLGMWSLGRVGAPGLWIAAAFVVIGASLAMPAARREDAETSTAAAGAAQASRDARPVVASEEERRSRTVDRVLVRADALARDVGVVPIPTEWLTGHYLSHAAEYPAIRESWSRVLDYAEVLRSSETQEYRVAYLSVLDAGGMSGPTRSLRLASALADFSAGAAKREAHFARIEELATASIALHDLLYGLAGEVSYEPALGARLSLDPVLEAVGRDESVQLQLESALDRVVAALDAGGQGPVSRDALLRWMRQGLAEALASE